MDTYEGSPAHTGPDSTLVPRTTPRNSPKMSPSSTAVRGVVTATSTPSHDGGVRCFRLSCHAEGMSARLTRVAHSRLLDFQLPAGWLQVKPSRALLVPDEAMSAIGHRRAGVFLGVPTGRYIRRDDRKALGQVVPARSASRQVLRRLKPSRQRASAAGCVWTRKALEPFKTAWRPPSAI